MFLIINQPVSQKIDKFADEKFQEQLLMTTDTGKEWINISQRTIKEEHNLFYVKQEKVSKHFSLRMKEAGREEEAYDVLAIVMKQSFAV